jgi:hypothetical protein
MKQTAVEWLEFRYKNNVNLMDYDFNQAKEMEKQQQGYSKEDLEKAFKVGFTLGYVGDTLIADKDKCFNRWFKIFKDNQDEENHN